jgi:hypothetical protein
MTQTVRTNDEAVTGSKKIFFSFSLLFEGTVYNNPQGYACLKCKKKSKINPPYCIMALNALKSNIAASGAF